MNVIQTLRDRLRPGVAAVVGEDATRDAGGHSPPYVDEMLQLVRPAQDAKFGDYQANFAMSLGKRLSRQPREVAGEILKWAELADLCQPPEVAGPGFINLRLKYEWIAEQLNRAVHDERLRVERAKEPRTIVIDYSSPNVAKPMHVGHIRSTVIGDALARTLRFLGHKVITDNHLGDWGTQFGMIIYGFKHFVDRAAYEAAPVAELSRLYKLVHRLVDYRESVKELPAAKKRLAERSAEVERLKEQPKSGDKAADKKAGQALAKAQDSAKQLVEEVAALDRKISAVEGEPQLAAMAKAHANIDEAVLEETAKLHADDPENLRLWNEFLPNCRDEIARVYGRLNVTFDYEHGESFYHERLAPVVQDLERKGLAENSQGAVCVFVEGFETPMIVQKKDGAFLYATSDLATIQYRMETWQPDVILYVVDHRQGEHFDKLFAVARRWGYRDVQLSHVKFGTVLGKDGRPYKTREGTAEGLESLIDEAVSRAGAVVAENDVDGRLSADERRQIAETVAIGALKYADLSQNRTSDYTFSYDKMLMMNGNTATYMQYSYARVRSIFAKGGYDAAAVRKSGAKIVLGHEAERALGVQLLRLSEALTEVEEEFMPHYLTGYLFDLAKAYSTFFEKCPVLKAESEEIRSSRLLLCDLTARTIRAGLEMLGIEVVERM